MRDVDAYEMKMGLLFNVRVWAERLYAYALHVFYSQEHFVVLELACGRQSFCMCGRCLDPVDKGKWR